jgi:hypothetical protein
MVLFTDRFVLKIIWEIFLEMLFRVVHTLLLNCSFWIGLALLLKNIRRKELISPCGSSMTSTQLIFESRERTSCIPSQ